MSLFFSRLPALIRKRWSFWPMYDDYLKGWHVGAQKTVWGVSGDFFAESFEQAYEKAVSFAEEEEAIVNGPATLPAPPMEVTNAAE
jgi:hypothetical protein